MTSALLGGAIVVAACLWPVVFAATSATPPVAFQEIAAQAGLSFTLDNCPTDHKYLVETMPGGIAIFDYDGDGRPDIYFTNGAEVPSLEKTGPRYWNRLFHNEGALRFRDVTEIAGVAGVGYSMGAAAADYDNDGRSDLFVAGVNRNILYHNLGNGRFEDVTEKAGIRSGEWATAAGWFDFDRDGKLDLWVVHYVKWPPATDRYCGDPSRGVRVYCHPKYFEGMAATLYRNRGDGTFEDVTARAGLASYAGMSIALADYDQDGWPDVFVANDKMPNFLFHNLGNGGFKEVALTAGTALRDSGNPVSSMGAEFKDYNNDGLPDLIVTALAGESFPVFRNIGKGGFVDATDQSRLGLAAVKHSGWGLALGDLNNDGWKDLFTANAHVNDRVEEFEPTVYRDKDTVFVNDAGSFRDVSDAAGFSLVKAHRGAALADLNADGRLDAIVSALGEPAELWHNVTLGVGHWIELKLVGTKSNRDGIGTRVRVGSQYEEMTTAMGYASSANVPLHFGLAAAAVVPKIEIRWSSGVVQFLTNVKADQVLQVTEPAR